MSSPPEKRKLAPAEEEEEEDEEEACKKKKKTPCMPLSLDADDCGGAVATADAPQYHAKVFEPAAFSDLDIAQEDILAVVRCASVDVARFGSDFMDTLLECAAREKTKRICIPDGCFQTSERMFAFFCIVCGGGGGGEKDVVALKVSSMLEMLHAANRLGMLHLAGFGLMLDTLCAPTTVIPLSSMDQIDLGMRYHRAPLVAKGALQLAVEWSANPAQVVPDHLVRSCMPHWLPLIATGSAIFRELDKFYSECDKQKLDTQRAYPQCVACVHSIARISYSVSKAGKPKV